jgi:hypothetical protein
MNIKIQHQEFINIKLKEPEYLTEFFNDICTLKQLIKKINKFSETDFQKFNYPDSEKFKGNIFEIFAEVFFKLYSSHNKIGIYDYQPVNGNQDYGVDGIGTGMDGKPATVQVKFRSNNTTSLTSNDIKQFPFQSIVAYGVEPKTRSNMIVFTTAKNLHWVTDGNVFLGTISTIGYQAISTFVDNNWVFWKNLQDLIQQNLCSKN